jgi:hypothetical protein
MRLTRLLRRTYIREWIIRRFGLPFEQALYPIQQCEPALRRSVQDDNGVLLHGSMILPRAPTPLAHQRGEPQRGGSPRRGPKQGVLRTANLPEVVAPATGRASTKAR